MKEMRSKTCVGSCRTPILCIPKKCRRRQRLTPTREPLAMGKTGSDFDPDAYAPVAERIRLFYQAHPLGRIETELVRRTADEVVFKALVYRTATDAHPAATGWAAERE